MSGPFDLPVGRLFLDAASQAPEFGLLGHVGNTLTLNAIAGRVFDLHAALLESDCRRGDPVAVMLDNHPDHVATILSLAIGGFVWVPINIRFAAANIAPMMIRTGARVALADAAHGTTLRAAGFTGPIVDPTSIPGNYGKSAACPDLPRPDDVRAILFTSGTTGTPKGVMVTERMFAAAGQFAGRVSQCGRGETYLFWEPLYHIGGAQMVPMAIGHQAVLAMVPGFSASRFWDQARVAQATRIHYLGGTLDLLMKQPARPSDHDHRVELAFGAGAKPRLWRAFEERFGVRLVEVYGMTEASSFSTVNLNGVVGSIGKAVAEFDVEVQDDTGKAVAVGTLGEICLRASPPGLITPGYLDDPVATADAGRGGWFLTGDLAWQDDDGNFHYAGRKKEAIRHRGENVSAWEVEQVLNMHPAVLESAVIGVPAEIGEEEVFAIVRPVGEKPDPVDLIAWCRRHMAAFQVPRFIAFVDEFERTPTERIRKKSLSRNTSSAWDREMTTGRGEAAP